jgi:hypothetical protein
MSNIMEKEEFIMHYLSFSNVSYIEAVQGLKYETRGIMLKSVIARILIRIQEERSRKIADTKMRSVTYQQNKALDNNILSLKGFPEALWLLV